MFFMDNRYFEPTSEGFGGKRLRTMHLGRMCELVNWNFAIVPIGFRRQKEVVEMKDVE